MTTLRRLIVLNSAPAGPGHRVLSAVDRIAGALRPVWPEWRLALNRLAPVPPGREGMTHRILGDAPAFRARWDEMAPALPLISEINPLAERCAYLAGTLRLGAHDALFLPEADLSDLEMLAEFFLTRPLQQTPCVFAHMSALAPRRPPQRAGIAHRIARLGRRLDRLDVIGTRLVLTAENAVLAGYFSDNGLPAQVASLHLRNQPAEPRRIAAIAIASDETSLEAVHAMKAFLADRGEPLTLRLLRSALPHPESDFAVAAHGLEALTVEAVDQADLTFDPPDLLLADPALMPRILEREGAFSAVTQPIAFAPAAPFIQGGEDGFSAEDGALGTGRTSVPLARAIRALEGARGPASPPPALEEVMEAHATPHFPERSTPVIVHIAPAWSGAGSSHVFEAQLRILEERGFAVFAVHLDTNTQTAVGKVSAETIVTRLAGENAAARWLVCRQRESVLAEGKYGLIPPYKLGHFSLEGEGRVAQTAEVPASLQEALAARRPEAILLNYAHLTPFLARLGLPGVPVVLETHDVRSVQHAIYNKSPLDETDRALEFDLFAHSDLTVFINKAEEDEFSARHEGHPSASIFPFLDEPVGAAEEPTTTPVSPILELANKVRAGQPAATPGAVPLKVIDALLDKTSSTPPIALFVGTDHRANVNSLHWYLSEVVAPHLAGRDLLTVIVGNIEAFFVGQALPNVHFLGRVPTLEPFYARADVVLLPVREGTGLPIKTLDAIRRRTPFVASSRALAAIPGMIDRFGAYDEPAAFAARVLELAHDDGLRAEEAARLEAFAGANARAEDYGRAWDEVFSRVGAREGERTARYRAVRNVPLLPPAEAVEGVAALATGRGLMPAVHLAPKDNGALVSAKPYSRLRLRADEPGSARVHFKARALTGTELLLEIFCEGTPAGRVRLGAGPVDLSLPLPLPAGEGPREHILEFLLRDGAPPGAGADGSPLFALSDLSLHMRTRV